MNETLWDNIARLVRVAEPRVRMTTDERERVTRVVADALGERRLRARPKRHIWRPVLAAAAVLLLLGIAAWVTFDRGASPVERADTEIASLEPSEAAGTRPDRTEPNGPAPPEADTTLPREPVEGELDDRDAATDSEPHEEEVDDATPSSTGAPTLVASVTFAESVAELPRTVDVWVRAAVELPLVAESHLHRIPWPTGARSAELPIQDAHAIAAAYGVDRVYVQIEAEGVAPGAQLVDTGGRTAGSIAIDLAPGATVRGFVTDASTGAPIERALVVVIDELPYDKLNVQHEPDWRAPSAAAYTDTNGAFTIEHATRRSAVTVRASHDDFAPAWQRVQRDPLTNDLTSAALELGAGCTVEGIVERSDGTRWEGAGIVISAETRELPTDGRTPVMTFGAARSGASGEYVVEHLPPGSYVAVHLGAADNETAGPIELRQLELAQVGETTRCDFLARQNADGGSLTARLTGADGAPKSGLSLVLLHVENGQAQESDWRAAQTDGTGSIELGDLPNGDYELYLSSSGYATIQHLWSGTIAGATHAEVQLAETQLQVRAVRDADGETLAGAWVIVERRSDLDDEWLFVGRGPTLPARDGSGPAVTFAGVPTGRYRVSVVGSSADLGSLLIDQVDIAAEAPKEIEARVPAGATLRVVVTDATTGAPIAGIGVQVFDHDAHEVPQERTARTDSAGSASIKHAPFGRLRLRLVRDGETIQEVDAPFREGGDPLRVQIRSER